jgi:hypothetical protein
VVRYRDLYRGALGIEVWDEAKLLAFLAAHD